MVLSKLVWRNYGIKSPVSMKCQNLHSFKEGVILLCQSILETVISQLQGSALFRKLFKRETKVQSLKMYN